jgi:hypothetical protein
MMAAAILVPALLCALGALAVRRRLRALSWISWLGWALIGAGVPVLIGLPGPLYVVKSQIHAGGRGKGKFKELGADAKGGVRLAFSIDEVRAHAGKCSATRW